MQTNLTLLKTNKLQRNTIQFQYYFIVLALFNATWLCSNIAAVKLVSVFGFTLTGGFIIFPFTAMFSGIIVEVYGYKNSRQAIWSGFILNATFILFMHLVNIIPASPYWTLGEQFANILIPSTRIIIASLMSFLFYDFTYSYVMAKMKLQSKGKSLIKRIIFAFLLASSIDILCFMMLAFYGAIPSKVLTQLILLAYSKKIACQLLLLPFIWFLIHTLKKAEQVEIFDDDTVFNPFKLDNIYEMNTFKNTQTNMNTLAEVIS